MSRPPLPPACLLCALLAGVLLAVPASARQDDEQRRIEVVKLEGVLDGPLERALDRAIEEAERNEAEAVVVQIDSRGVLGADRAQRMVDKLLGAPVPTITWVGPPGASAENGSAAVALAGHAASLSPGARIGPAAVADLRSRETQPRQVASLMSRAAAAREASADVIASVARAPVFADRAEDARVVDVVALQLPDLLRTLAGRAVTVGTEAVRLRTDPDGLSVRFHKADLVGRALHAVSKPSIAYLLLLLGLVGIVFELFHPSTGPAGAGGALSLALSGYGLWALGAWWLGVALIVVAVAAFAVDLHFTSLGLFSVAGLVLLVAGSLLLFPGPWLRISPWVLAVGIVGMTLFMITVMTRVLTDLRAIARGELEVRDPHPH